MVYAANCDLTILRMSAALKCFIFSWRRRTSSHSSIVGSFLSAMCSSKIYDICFDTTFEIDVTAYSGVTPFLITLSWLCSQVLITAVDLPCKNWRSVFSLSIIAKDGNLSASKYELKHSKACRTSSFDQRGFFPDDVTKSKLIVIKTSF